MPKPASLILIVLVCLAAGGLGSFFTPGDSGWYAGLAKPAYNPPSWIFAPVWTFLYIAMGVAAWLVLHHGRPGRLKTWAMILFALQLALNAAWTPVFFGLHQIGWALAILAALWVAVAVCMVVFARLHLPAGMLLLPYLAWTSFAGALNLSLWAMN